MPQSLNIRIYQPAFESKSNSHIFTNFKIYNY